ncbi:MAG: four helix bundle protein [Gemmatimonadota bacterium]
MHNFKELRVWHVASDLAVEIEPLTRALPRPNATELAGQLRRSALSIPSNIAEGCGRATRPDSVRFFGMALSSATETESHLLIAGKSGYLTAKRLRPLLDRVIVIEKMIQSLIDRLPPGE